MLTEKKNVLRSHKQQIGSGPNLFVRETLPPISASVSCHVFLSQQEPIFQENALISNARKQTALIE